MNALMRSSRFDDMPTVSAFANGRSAWPEIVASPPTTVATTASTVRTFMSSLLVSLVRLQTRGPVQDNGQRDSDRSSHRIRPLDDQESLPVRRHAVLSQRPGDRRFEQLDRNAEFRGWAPPGGDREA